MTTVPGRRPKAASQEDAARLAFAEGGRWFLMHQLGPAARARMQASLAEAFRSPATTPRNLDEIRQVVVADPVVPANHRVQRSIQEMLFNTTYETLQKQEAALLAELDRTDRMGPGSVEWDPGFPYPAYLTGVEFHLQRTGYVGTPLAGHNYHLGGNVFHYGDNEDAQANQKIVANMPAPADGQVRRVLELACAVGLSSVPLKRRFPDAEVIATDISAPNVRYAHQRAVEMGETIHFKQMAAEDLRFPDNSFDLVFVHILFHELPDEVARQAVAEAYRVLRPGGLFVVSDITDHSLVPPTGPERALAEYNHRWQVLYQGEVFHERWFRRDMAGLMREAGFRNVIPNYTNNMSVWGANLALPMRVGEK